MDAIVQIEQLSKHYGRRRALDSVSFEVGRGQVFGLLGPNGSGKTTLLGILLNVIRPTSGRVFALGETNLDRARARIGATLESPNFLPGLTGEDNLRATATIKGVAPGRVHEVLARVRLQDRQRDRFRKYSLGMRQRLALAGALLGDPELVVLDEPTNGLDPEGIREIRAVIQALADAGHTVVLASHLLTEVEHVCTHVAILKHGRLVAQGSVAELAGSVTTAELRAPDLSRLAWAIEAYPGATSSATRGDTLIVELSDGDLAALNEHLAVRGIYVSHLAASASGLEQAFVRLTSGGGDAAPARGSTGADALPDADK